MFKLGEPDRAIVRPLDPAYSVWEMSHDFLGPMIDSMVAQWRICLWRKLRPWASISVLLLVSLAGYWIYPDPIADLNKHGWSRSADLDPKDKRVVSYSLSARSLSERRSAVRCFNRAQLGKMLGIKLGDVGQAHVKRDRDASKVTRVFRRGSRQKNLSRACSRSRSLNRLSWSITAASQKRT
jgi:hypothetical protein